MAKPRICLNMMVKNEASHILRAIESVRPIIATWAICDTGSTDGTQEVIWGALRDLSGRMREDPWADFGTNRNKALDLARATNPDYILILDGDEELVIEDQQAFDALDADAYNIRIAKLRLGWRSVRLIKASVPWRWEGVVHEHLNTDGPVRMVALEGARILSHVGGYRSRQGDTLASDIALLEAAVAAHPERAREVFYLAQSYKDVGRVQDAIATYERRVALGGWQDEVWWSNFQLAKLYSLHGRWPEAIPLFLALYEQDPRRAEPLYWLATGYLQRNALAPAMLFYEEAMVLDKPEVGIFREDVVYDYAARLGYLHTVVRRGWVEEAVSTADALLRTPDLSDAVANEVLQLRDAALNLALQAAGLSLTGNGAPTPAPPR